ncbi:hypothetical protein VN12_22720 [Pirellula sp. SH-Sr6A]|uniref:hypothetical protein n=1 Tax=Pirellula sp. SH-Sr6A TaxID=1632865 RepID=UPI00078C5594|nr:hypothetical protein [Pirellula sp. SH-Sr6A]AMV34958.1 hypothetical protein VN12_22720 [Pirellula sp. SH-Sr6A]
MKIRFRIRTFFLGAIIVAVLLGILGSWWTRPYALTGSYANGQRAWEQWERRTLSLGIQSVETIRWFPDGSLAFRWKAKRANKKTYYSPNGDTIDNPQEWTLKYGHLIANAEEDSNSARPYKRLIWWWNDW